MKVYRKINAWQVLLLATSLGVISPGWFSADIFAQSLPQDSAGIVKDKTEQGFQYMTGGIGIGEREMMQNWAENYNLKLSFAEKSGVYLADVNVLIEKDGREMVRAITNGPWFYIQLPPGTYGVKATFKDETKEIKNVRLKAGDRVTRVMRWDLAEEFPIYASMKTNQN
jgi:hypothetical protein